MFLNTKYFLPALLTLSATLNSCAEKQPPASQTIKVQPSTPSTPQEKPRTSNMDKSPMDMEYFPADFPVLKMSGKATGSPIARVIYSRPSKDGRDIFGNVVKYGAYWRMGANEGTELEFFTDVIINGRKVKKGRYIIYSVPYKNKWTLKLNDDLYSWGLRIHSAKDVYSFDVPVSGIPNTYETLTMKFEPTDNGARLMVAWDTLRAYLPFKY